MLMQTKHKVSITVLVAIVAVVVGLGIVGVLNYHNSVSPASMPNENGELSDKVAVSTQGPPHDAANMVDSVAVKTNGISDKYMSPNQLTNVDEIQKANSGSFVGVVTTEFRHADGTVYQKYISHNTRTVQGINCAEQLLFATFAQGNVNTNGTNACTGLVVNTGATHFNGFNTIWIVNTTVGSPAMILNGSDTILTSKIGGTRMTASHGAITAAASQGGPISCTVAGTSTYNQITCTSGTYTFTGDRTSGTALNGVFLGNSTSNTATAYFAENGFAAVPVASTDTLTITWTITLT